MFISSLSSPRNATAELYFQLLFDRAGQQWELASERLASGLRINSPKDDPSGYITASGMRNEITGLTRAQSNVKKMDGVLDLADSALSNIGETLLSLHAEVLKGGNASASQISAKLSAIDFVAQSAQSGGEKLFSGAKNFFATQLSEQNNLQMKSVQVSRLDPRLIGQTQVMTILDDAKTGKVNADFGDINDGNGIANAVTFSFSGSYNLTETLEFAAGATNSDIATAVNGATSRTGLAATVNADNTITFATLGVGSDQTSIIQVRDGSISFTDGSGGFSRGSDLQARLDGKNVQALGRTLNVSTSGVAMTLRLDPTTPAGIAAGEFEFAVQGQGRTFQLGSNVESSQQITIGLPQISTYTLGGQYGALADLNSINWSNPNEAARGAQIVSTALDELAKERSKIGSLQKNLVAPAQANLSKQTDVLSDQYNKLISADLAAETSRKNRSEILMSAAILSLGDVQSLRKILLSAL